MIVRKHLNKCVNFFSGREIHFCIFLKEICGINLIFALKAFTGVFVDGL